MSPIAPEDEEFAAVLLKTAEFERDEPGYGNFVRFNLSAVERGEKVVCQLQRLKPLNGATVLDIGAGSGGMSIAFANAGANVLALEPDERRRRWLDARARGHSVRVRVKAGVAERLDILDNSVDVALLDSVIEHVSDARAAIREVARVLKPSGLVYLVSPNKLSLVSILRDPHYQMAGVVLMPRWLGRVYVEGIRRSRRPYWVNVIPTERWLKRRFAHVGVTLNRQVPEGLEKLDNPSTITRHAWIRLAARLFQTVRATTFLKRVAIAQNPTHVFIGTKQSAGIGSGRRGQMAASTTDSGVPGYSVPESPL